MTCPAFYHQGEKSILNHTKCYTFKHKCGASVAESCIALHQHWVLDTSSRDLSNSTF